MNEEDLNMLLNSEMVLDIVQLLSDGRERYAKEIADELDTTSQSVSKYLKVLRESKIIERGKRTQAQYYRINYEGMSNFWYNKLYQALIDRFEQDRGFNKDKEGVNEGEVHWADGVAFSFEELEEDYKILAQEYFELTLNTCDQNTLYEYLFRDFALSLNLSSYKHNDYFKDIEELRPLITGSMNYLALNSDVEDIKDDIEMAIDETDLEWARE